MVRASVAMAVYNGEKYLREQLDSIVCQLGSDDELVISYDRSDDGTLDIIEGYAASDGRVRVVMNPSSGITGNFENALGHCLGEYIFISDQDDVWAEDKIEKVMECFSATGADMVVHNGVHTDEDLNPVTDSFFEIYPIVDRGLVKNIIMARVSGCTTAFTRRIRDLIVPIPRIQDYDHWNLCIAQAAGKVAYLDEELILHRLHSQNATMPDGQRRPLKTIIRSRWGLITNLIKRSRQAKRA
ncbi:MAG: glycosyltransferase [Eubacteriaceae bacterium]|nr:glycosyltransferase [Eubacteriaceae bacterium]